MSDLQLLDADSELIAEAMLTHRGNLALVSREPTIPYNAMALRALVKEHPQIRTRYHELLAEELQDKGLHIAERILKMAEMQEEAFGRTIPDPEGGDPIEIPPDPKMVIEISKEISRLIAEGKGTPMSSKTTLVLTSKQDAKELLESFLDS